MRWTTEKLLAALRATDDCRTVEELAAATGIDRKQVAKSCGILKTRGLAERRRAGCYRLTEAGRIADRAVRSGPTGKHTGRRGANRAPSLRERIWRALRSLHKASLPELLQVASLGDEKDAASNARRYLGWLEQAGYIARLRTREPGTAPTSNGFVRWLLVRDSGPLPPRRSTRDGGLFDPNTGEAHPLRREGEL